MAPRAKPVYRSAAQKRAMVEQYFSRGERPGREVAAELGVPPQLIYNWKKKIDNGEPLTPDDVGQEPALEAKIDRAMSRAKVALTERMPKEPPKEYLFEEKPAPSTLEVSLLRQENARLQAEIARLRRALSAMLEDHCVGG